LIRADEKKADVNKADRAVGRRAPALALFFAAESCDSAGLSLTANHATMRAGSKDVT